MGYAKVYEGNNFNKEEGVYELDILGSIISAPHDNDNLFHFPAAYQRLEEYVRHHSIHKADEYNILDTKTDFIKNPEYKNASIVQAYFNPHRSIHFKNLMDFSTGELTFRTNYRRSAFGNKVSINTTATEITCYQYLGMTKIFGVQNVLPKTFLRSAIENDTALSVIQRYEDTKDDAEFFKDFINKTDNGRSSTRIADAFGLKITTIALVKKSNSVRLFLQPQVGATVVVWVDSEGLLPCVAVCLV
jgi:hypothetical protein